MSKIAISTLSSSLALGACLFACSEKPIAIDDRKGTLQGANQEFSVVQKAVEKDVTDVYTGSGQALAQAQKNVGAKLDDAVQNFAEQQRAARGGLDATVNDLEQQLNQLSTNTSASVHKMPRAKFETELNTLSADLKGIRQSLAELGDTTTGTFQSARGHLEVRIDELKTKIATLRSGA